MERIARARGAGILLGLVVASALAALSAARGLGSDDVPARRAVPTAPTDPWTRPAAPTLLPTRYTRFETLTREDGLPCDRVTCLLAEGEDLVVGTEHGLALRRAGTWSTIGKAQGLRHDYVTAVARHAATGDLWVATLRGLHRLTGGEVRAFTQQDSGLINDVVYHVATAGDLVWAATAAGTSVLDVTTGSWALWDQRNSIMHEPWCYALALGPGRAWIGVWGGGVVERDLATGRWREYRDPDGEMEIDLLADDGPIHDVTSFVAYDEGPLWQSSYFGLARFDGRAWRSWTAKESGLAGDFVAHVAARGDHAWVSTDRGLSVFDGETCVTYRRTADGSCAVTTWRDGHEAGSTTLPTAPADNYLLWSQPTANGVWLATGHGLSRGVVEPPAGPAR
jgi:ligand-binding sensor domain-containing protein